MNETLSSRDQLQPSLLDRLLDDEPDVRVESITARTISRTRLREIVLRDLGWLFNATALFNQDSGEKMTLAHRSVINFGLPSMNGKSVSDLDMCTLEQMLRQAILHFEPRILPINLYVKSCPSADALDHTNVIPFEISGQLWAHPYPLELLLKTDLDMETGLIQVNQVSASAITGPTQQEHLYASKPT